MNVTAQVQEMDAMVSKGDIVNAVKSFFADTAKTSDYSQVKTADKTQMVEKMEGFLAAIEKVNGITPHRTLVDGQASASEFTFNFNMKDGSKIYWHEVIRRIWNDEGQVVAEEYFNAGG